MVLKYGNDLNVEEFCSEICSFRYLTAEHFKQNFPTPLQLLQFIYNLDMKESYPNVEIILRIFLTLPVTSASCERAFSKMKIIKNYLRSAIGQERLTNLSILSIEFDVTNSLSFDDVIDKFSSLKARKIKF